MSAYRFVVMNGGVADYPAIFRAACDRLGLAATIEAYPYIRPHEFSRAKLQDIRRRLRRRHEGEMVAFCPGAMEHFVEGADVSFQFSAYRSWRDASTIVLPHPWSPVRPPSGSELRWREKPPLAVGFMGTTYGGSRAARLVSRGPDRVRRWLLAGGLVRHAGVQALLDELGVPHRYAPAFPRFEALDALRRSRALEGEGRLEIVDTAGFDGTARKIDRFANHLLRTTYVFCPRGCENYSFRVYEALAFGRVPVILDTDMVLPDWIAWDEVALVLPGDAADHAWDLIVDDYLSRSAEAFRARQEAALRLARELASERWLAAEIAGALGIGKTRDLVPASAAAMR